MKLKSRFFHFPPDVSRPSNGRPPLADWRLIGTVRANRIELRGRYSKPTNSDPRRRRAPVNAVTDMCLVQSEPGVTGSQNGLSAGSCSDRWWVFVAVDLKCTLTDSERR